MSLYARRGVGKLVHRPICKNAGAGGFSGSKVTVSSLCHNRARTGMSAQCFTCVIPGLAPRKIGCNTTGVPCVNNNGCNCKGRSTSCSCGH